ncbi:MAG: transcriptional repressor [Thermodesulfobacteriota bacterium]
MINPRPGQPTTRLDINPQRSARLDNLLDKLKARGLRMTPQRLSILRTLVMHSGHPTVEELHRILTIDYPSMSLATVYKTITLLKMMGEVLELEFSNRDNRFDGNNPRPHPHLICTSCRRIFDPLIPDLSRIIEELSRKTGYSVTSHRLDFYGLCPDCQRAR